MEYQWFVISMIMLGLSMSFYLFSFHKTKKIQWWLALLIIPVGMSFAALISSVEKLKGEPITDPPNVKFIVLSEIEDNEYAYLWIVQQDEDYPKTLKLELTEDNKKQLEKFKELQEGEFTAVGEYDQNGDLMVYKFIPQQIIKKE